MPTRRKRSLGLTLLAAGSGWAVATGGAVWVQRRWSRTLVADCRTGSLAVVVPGFRNPGPRPNAVNRARVRTALRTVATATAAGTAPAEIRLICSGGVVGPRRVVGRSGIARARGGTSEARLLAAEALRLGYRGALVLEEDSRTTWENIARVVPLLDDVDRIAVASQPAHALKARAYLRRQRPDLADRLVPADDRLGQWTLLAPVLALHGLRSLRGLTAAERRLR